MTFTVDWNNIPLVEGRTAHLLMFLVPVVVIFTVKIQTWQGGPIVLQRANYLTSKGNLFGTTSLTPVSRVKRSNNDGSSERIREFSEPGRLHGGGVSFYHSKSQFSTLIGRAPRSLGFHWPRASKFCFNGNLTPLWMPELALYGIRLLE